jgi:hypothetical protein
MTDSKSQLEVLRQQQLVLVQKIKDAEAKAKKKEREDNERRKLLAGAAALAELQENPDSPFAATLLARLSLSLKRPADRALFPALPSPESAKALAKADAPAPEPAKPIEESKALAAPALPPADALSIGENESVADYLQRALSRSFPSNRYGPESSSR